MYSIDSGLRVFLDCGNYFGDNINLGDEAVLRGIAEGFFPKLFASGHAAIIDAADVNAKLSTAAHIPHSSQNAPDIDATLMRIEELAEQYAQLCRVAEPIDGSAIRLAS